MAPVIELAVGGDEQTVANIEESGLAGTPITSTVGPDEQLRFALVSKRGTVTVARDTETTEHSAGRGYKTVTVVTDVRVMVVVGGDDGGDDRVIPIPMEAIDDVETHTSLLSGGLRVQTAGGEGWTIPCKGELDAVVEFLETAMNAWRRAGRLVAEARDRIGYAESAVDRGDTDAAFDALDDAEQIVVGGRDRLSTFDVGSRVPEMAGLTDCSDRIEALRRRAHAAIGDAARERARTASDVDAYGEAVDAYADARDAYERALTYDGAKPEGGDLRERLSTVHSEEADLAARPKSVARAAYDRANQCEQPLAATREYHIALDRYRELLGLSWGPTAFFVGDSDAIQERILDIVDAIVDARVAAARGALSAADTFEARGETEAGLAACAVAEVNIEAPLDLVEELAPDRAGALGVYRRLIEDVRERLKGESTMPPADASESGSEDHAETDQSEPQVTGIAVVGEDGDSSAEAEPATGITDMETDPEEWTPLSQGTTPATESASAGTAGEHTASLAGLNRAGLKRLVAKVWEALGWTATVNSGPQAHYDVRAALRTPVEVRMAVRTVHDPDGTLAAADVDRCAADRGADDVVALVSTATVPESVRQRASDHGVRILDGEGLSALLESEGLTHLLDGLTVDN